MYIVIEMQTANNQTTLLANDYDNLNEANSKFHQILAAAAVSTVEIHSAAILTSDGIMIKTECYRHGEE